MPVEEIVQGIKHGMRKVNIDTDLRMASTGAVPKFLAENKKEFDPRKWRRPRPLVVFGTICACPGREVCIFL